jgi:hypothetical protein
LAKTTHFLRAALAAMQAVPDHGAKKTKDVPPIAAVITMSVTASTTRRIDEPITSPIFSD